MARFCALIFCLCAALALGASGRSLSMPQYTSELDRLSALAAEAIDRPAAASMACEELRGGWNVESRGQVFDIDTAWMLDGFKKLKAKPDNAIRDQLLDRIMALRSDAQAFEEQPPDSAAARNALKQILGRREFHQVRGPSRLDRLKFRIQLWILRFLARFFGSSSVPVINRIVVWILVSIALLFAIFFVYRSIKQSARVESLMLETPSRVARNWRAWMEDSEAAGAKGLWREAIHLGYWAAVSFLEESGTWRPDQARTPREYLRLLPAESEQRSTLAILTGRLERTWYGSEQAGPDGFSETLANLEKLGCRRP
ncbi:MAG: DUF4129 domain-containing protein [Acidobacteria bacterium]|nr:DUF4129 domain-containing protein [Acidobacteriota bacterium]